MFSSELLMRIYTNKEMLSVPVCHQTTVVRVVEKAIREMEEENDTEPDVWKLPTDVSKSVHE